MSTIAPKILASILPLVMRDVSYRIGGRTLLDRVNVTFSAGPRSFLLGHNGAGKTLMLRLLHGVIRPSMGRIEWHGSGPKTGAGGQAMVFQRPLMLRRRAKDNIFYALSVRGFRRCQWGTITDRVLSRTGLADYADYPARLLSVGQQQCLALARAWAIRPQVLFLDEPTASLDPVSLQKVEDIINAIHGDGCKIIAATHDLGQARRLGDEILFIDRGRIAESGTCRAFFDGPKSAQGKKFLAGILG